MTEKRFTHINALGNPTIWNKKNDKKYIQYDEETTDEICDLLNELVEENDVLKKELQIYRDGLRAEIRETKEVFEDYSECVDESLELKQENERLRNNIEQLNLAIDDIASHTSCDELKKENKQLQEEKKWLKHQLEKLKKFEEWKDE